MQTCDGKLTRTYIPSPVLPSGVPLWTNPCSMRNGKPEPFLDSRQMGQGSYGTVFEAYCGNQDKFAVKWVHDRPNSELSPFDRVKEEIRIQNIAAPYQARPVYELLLCEPKQSLSVQSRRPKAGFVTDRLDNTLHSDMYTLSQEQSRRAMDHYDSILIPLIAFCKKRRLDTLGAYALDSYRRSLSYSIDEMEKILKKIEEKLDEHGTDFPFPKLILHDTVEQQRKKSFQLLKAMNCLQGLENNAILHNDAHPGNLMWRKGDTRYYAIDFGMAETVEYIEEENSDIHFLQEKIFEHIDRRENHVVQHDVKYLAHMVDYLSSIVDFEYEYDYADYEKIFNKEFDEYLESKEREERDLIEAIRNMKKQQVQRQLLKEKEMKEVHQLVLDADKNLSKYGMKRSTKRMKTSKSKSKSKIKKTKK